MYIRVYLFTLIRLYQYICVFLRCIYYQKYIQRSNLSVDVPCYHNISKYLSVYVTDYKFVSIYSSVYVSSYTFYIKNVFVFVCTFYTFYICINVSNVYFPCYSFYINIFEYSVVSPSLESRCIYINVFR